LSRLAAPLAIACLTAGSPVCARVKPYNPDRLPAEQMGRIREICHTVIGLAPGFDTHSMACQESLSHSVAARTPQAMAAPVRPAPPRKPAKSYFSASSDEIHRREQEACAEIGETPATRDFAVCVASLQSHMFDADSSKGWRR
jgi:hypothetical protein